MVSFLEKYVKYNKRPFHVLFIIARTDFQKNEFIRFLNSSHWFSILPLSTTKAAEVCKLLGAELVSVESFLEDAFLTSALNSFYKKYS